MDFEEEICVSCNGSGEGHYDGTRCWSCRGTGVDRYSFNPDNDELIGEDE